MGFDLRSLIVHDLWPISIAVLTVLTVLVHIVFANAVYGDAKRLQDLPRGRLVLVGPTMWFLATLVGGVITAGIYWAMHHSRLNRTVDEPPVETEENSE